MTTRANAESLGRAASASGARVAEVANALAGRGPVHSTPVHRRLSQQRRFVTVRTELSDYRAIREVHGGTVNDVILATIAGGLRGWLMARAESLGGLRTIKAIVPMSVIDDELEPTSLGSQITGHLVHLPIGEPSPVVRLHQVSYDLRAHRDNGRNVSARRLSGIAGFAPDDVPRTRGAAGHGRAAPRLPRVRHQRAGAAVPALRRRRPDARVLPRPPAAARPPARHRRDVVRRRGVLRHHDRPRRRARRRRPPPVRARGARRAEGLGLRHPAARPARTQGAQPRRRRRDPPLPPVVPADAWPRTGRPTARASSTRSSPRTTARRASTSR